MTDARGNVSLSPDPMGQWEPADLNEPSGAADLSGVAEQPISEGRVSPEGSGIRGTPRVPPAEASGSRGLPELVSRGRLGGAAAV